MVEEGVFHGGRKQRGKKHVQMAAREGAARRRATSRLSKQVFTALTLFLGKDF